MDILNIIPDQAVNARQSSLQTENEEGSNFESFLTEASEEGKIKTVEDAQSEDYPTDADAKEPPAEADSVEDEEGNQAASESDIASEDGESSEGKEDSGSEEAAERDPDMDAQGQAEISVPVITNETVDIDLLIQEGVGVPATEEEPAAITALESALETTTSDQAGDGIEKKGQVDVTKTENVDADIGAAKTTELAVEKLSDENTVGRADHEKEEALDAPGKFAGIFRRRNRASVHRALQNSSQAGDQPSKIESFLEEILGKKLADEIKTYLDIARLTGKDSTRIPGTISGAASKPALEHSNTDENQWYSDGFPGNATGTGEEMEMNGVERGKFSETLANIMRRPNIAMHVIRQIAPVAASLLSDGRTEFSISLNPPQLGHVRLSVVSDGQSLMARIQVDSDGLKDALERSLDDLRRSLQNQGVEIEGFEVSVNSGSDNLFSNESEAANGESLADGGAHGIENAQNEDADGMDLIGNEGLLNIVV